MYAFWWNALLIGYTFIGYGLIMRLLVGWQGLRKQRSSATESASALCTPPMTLVIPAYNERAVLADKLANCRRLRYPEGRLQLVFVTDGSDDGSEAWLREHAPEARVLHQAERRGKAAAINRALAAIDTPLAAITDANAMATPDALLWLSRAFARPEVGAASGEKRVATAQGAGPAGQEGLYWRYESALKRWDAEWYSLVGAVGELLAFRTALFRPLPENTLLDDFQLSMGIAAEGYRVAYVPAALVLEGPSANFREEFKRKTRIATGGLQSLWRFRASLLSWQRPRLSFCLLSHRALRWTVTPWALPMAFLAAALLAKDGHPFYSLAFGVQLLFYTLAALGWRWAALGRLPRLLSLPFYFCMMNVAVMGGQWRWVKKRRPNVAWEKARRAAWREPQAPAQAASAPA